MFICREIKMKPITPDEVKKEFTLPDKAIGIINKKIIDCFTGYESIINKEELILELKHVGFCNNVITNILSKISKTYIQFGWNIQETPYSFIFQELQN
jgi:hypothetical protein